MLQTIYSQLHNHLFDKLSETIMQPLGLPGLLWFDRFFDQFNRMLLNENTMLPIRFPAILVDFQELPWNIQSGQATSDQGTIVFYIGYENYADSYQNTFLGSENQGQALKDYQFLEQVLLTLNGFQTDNLSLKVNLSRVDNAYDNLIVHEIECQARITVPVSNPLYTSVDLVDLCALPSIPTPPAFNGLKSYIRGQKVTFQGKKYLYINPTSASGNTPVDTAYWCEIPDSSLFLVLD